MNDKIVLISLNTFSCTGGIPQVAKNLTYALSQICKEQGRHFQALALYDETSDIRYVDARTFNGFKQNRFLFLQQIISHQKKAEIIILSHINLLPLAFILRKINKQVKLVLIAHGIEIWSKLPNWKKRLLKNDIYTWSVSEFTKSEMTCMHKVPDARISVLHNCLDPFFQVPVSFNKPRDLVKRYKLNDVKILLSITRMENHDIHKGYDKIIKIMPDLLKRYPKLHYLLCGKGHPKEILRLRQLIKELQLERHVTLTGFIAVEELKDHYLLADLFVLPSKKEGFGIAFIEAAACGRHTISGNTDGSTEAMLNGKLGQMINPDDPEALQQAIINGLSIPTPISMQHRQRLCLDHFSAIKYQENITKLLISSFK